MLRTEPPKDYNNCSANKVDMLMKLIRLFILVIFLAGCSGQEIYSHLTEQEANEMVALLHDAGIMAKKHVLNDQSFGVSAASADFASAVELLNTNGYPRNRFESLGQVFKKEGFVSSPLEERARLNYAQSQELANTLESIDGVVLARVHLAVPETDSLSDESKPASASIFIKHRLGVDLSTYEGQIKALVVNGIEGLPYENVTVAMFPAKPMSSQKQPGGEKILLAASSGNFSQMTTVLLTIIMLAFLGGVSWLFLERKKQKSGLPVVPEKSKEES